MTWGFPSTGVCLLALGCNQSFSFDVPSHAEAEAGVPTKQDSGTPDAAIDPDCATRCPTWKLVYATDWHACVECNYDSDCQAIGKKRCWAEDHRCVDCATDRDCIAGQQHCVSQTGECRPACAYGSNDDDCGTDHDMRCSDLNVCLSCDRDIECLSTGRGKRCLPGSGYCVACVTDTDCGGGLKCDTITHACVACKDGRSCPSGGCNVTTHQCY